MNTLHHLSRSKEDYFKLSLLTYILYDLLMKFVFVSYIPSRNFNQPKDWIKRLSCYLGVLESLSKQHSVINIEQINYKGQHLQNGVQHHFMDFGEKKSFFPCRLHHFIKNLKPDIVLIHSLNMPFQLIQLRLLLGRNVKIIVQNHAEKPFTGIKRLIQRLADRYIDAYFFASYDMGVEWVSKGNLRSTNKIYEVMEVSSIFYPMDRKLARQKTQIRGDAVFLWVGRLNQNKDPLTVVKAFLQFVKYHPFARLYMIYHTQELLKEVKNLIDNEIENKESFFLIGEIPHEEMLYWYNSADFIISGSHYEGSGTAICEAMSCGCMPILTDIFSFRMLTGYGKCGWLYEVGNEQSLLEILKRSITADLDEMRTKTLNQFKEELSFDAIADKISEIAPSL